MRAVAVWIGYLMYLLFAITALSIILYAVNSYLALNKLKVTLASLENLLIALNSSINEVKTCINCYREVKIKVPPGSTLYLNNGSIYAVTISSAYYNFSSQFVDVSIQKIGSLWKYNLSTSNKFFGKVVIEREGCIGINKTSTHIYVENCK
jgi:hypothetical protein